MVLYAAADAPLSEIPERTPPEAFSVRPVQAMEESVRAHFTKPHVYFLGAHTGCSCGFSYGVGGDEDVAGRESVGRLGAFLADAVERAGPLELYACWDGDESEPATERAMMAAADFSGEAVNFDLPERCFAIVVRSIS